MLIRKVIIPAATLATLHTFPVAVTPNAPVHALMVPRWMQFLWEPGLVNGSVAADSLLSFALTGTAPEDRTTCCDLSNLLASSVPIYQGYAGSVAWLSGQAALIEDGGYDIMADHAITPHNGRLTVWTWYDQISRGPFTRT